MMKFVVFNVDFISFFVCFVLMNFDLGEKSGGIKILSKGGGLLKGGDDLERGGIRPLYQLLTQNILAQARCSTTRPSALLTTYFCCQWRYVLRSGCRVLWVVLRWFYDV